MLHLKLDTIRKKALKDGYYSVGYTDNFCCKALNNGREKCVNFYTDLLDQDSGLFICPYGYCCYKPFQNAETILTSIVCEKSELTKIKDRRKSNDKVNKTKTKIVIFNFNVIKQKFDLYEKYIQFVFVCNNACHDLTNALNYLVELLELINQKRNSEIVSYYNQIIDKAKSLQKLSVFEPFDYNKDYTTITCQKDLVDNLWKLVEDAYSFSERKLKDIENESDKDLVGVYSGISLLRTLLRRNILTIDDFSLPEKRTEFYIHKIVKKVVLLLSYKAEMKNVTFPPFAGFNKKKINGYQDSVFTIIFTVIDNAIKYSEMGDSISISFNEENPKGSCLRIANHSKPLTKYDLERIHERNYRGSNRTQKGHGLGLFLVDSICKKIKITNHADYSDGMFIYTFYF